MIRTMSFLSLPDNVIEAIFNQLNLDELATCRLVNKRCKKLIDASPIESLSVHRGLHPDGSFGHKRAYEFTSELIRSTSFIVIAEDLRFLEFGFIERKLFKLKKLAIVRVSIEEDLELEKFENQINQLQSLEHLQIGTFINTRGRRNLRLNHIRTFAIDRCGVRPIILTAPALTRLATRCDPLNFQLSDDDRNRLTHLTLLGARIADLSGYSTETLEYLRLEGMPADFDSIHFILLTCPKLRELHIPMINRAAARDMMKQKELSGNEDLVIYLSGLPIVSLEDVEQLFGEQTMLETVQLPWLVENLERLRSVDHAIRVDYFELVTNLDRPLIDSFIRKFPRIQRVDVGEKIGSALNLLSFFQNCRAMKELVILKSPLVQHIYNQLPEHCESLEILDITLPAEQVISPQFTLKFLGLKALIINRHLEREFVNKLFDGKREFNLEFLIGGRWVYAKNTCTSWRLEL